MFPCIQTCSVCSPPTFPLRAAGIQLALFKAPWETSWLHHRQHTDPHRTRLLLLHSPHMMVRLFRKVGSWIVFDLVCSLEVAA